MNDDIISRKAAILALVHEQSWNMHEDQRMAIRVIADLPSAEAQQWIPVTERLPEEEGWYLVCCNGVYPVEIGRFYIDEDGERYFGCDWNDPDDIEAWMRLPEPYKRGEWKNE